jgi:hypothetical protein
VPTPTLRELQSVFWRSLTPGRDPDPALIAVVSGTPELPPPARVGIYVGMYSARIIDALTEDFPKLAGLVGGERFETLVRDYIARQPSTAPSIRHIGSAFPEFVTEHEGRPLGDLARLEWARLDVFDAPDAEAITVADLRAVPADEWPALRLALLPACTRLVTAWPVHRVWIDDALPDVPARTALRVWREGAAVYQTAMDDREALDRLAAGEPFGLVCEEIDDAAEAAALLLRWIEDGIVAWASARGTDPQAGSPA